MSVVLVKALRSGEWGYLQAVEKIVLETNGEPHLSIVGLTDRYLLVFDSKPKRILKVIPLSKISDIQIVADRRMLIKRGSNSHICQHVQVVYKESNTDLLIQSLNHSLELSSVIKSKKDKSNSTSNLLKKRASSRKTGMEDSSSYSSLSISSSSATSKNSDLKRFYIQNQTPSISSQSNEFDLPDDIANLYSPCVPLRMTMSSHETHESTSGSSSPFSCDRSSDSEDSFLTSGRQSGVTYKNTSATKCNTIPRRAKSVLGVHSAKNVDPNPQTGQIFQSHTNLNSSLIKDKSEASNPVRSSKDHHADTAANDVEQIPSWIHSDEPIGMGQSDNNRNEISKEFSDDSAAERPSSVDISQIETLRRKLFGGLFLSSRSSSRLTSFTRISSDPVLHNMENSRSVSSKNESEMSNNANMDDQNQERIENIYIYKSQSKFLNELYLWWTRHLMEHENPHDTCNIGIDSCQKLTSNWKLQDAEKAYQRVTDTWSPFSRSFWKIHSSRGISTALSSLQALYVDLQKHKHLKRMMWKNWDTILNLMGIVHSTEALVENGFKNAQDLSNILCLMALGMEVFRLLYSSLSTDIITQESVSSASGTYTFSSTDGTKLLNLPMNFGQLTQMIVKVTLKCNMISPAANPVPEHDSVKQLLRSPHHFSNGAWLGQPNSQQIRLTVISFNAAVSLLYEILAIEYFSAKDQERLAFMATLQNHSLDTYIGMSITQVVNILRSHASHMQFQKSLLFNHLFVMRILLDKCIHLKSFIRENHLEDFKYFIHDRNIRRAVPENHPLLPKLLECSFILHQEILDS